LISLSLICTQNQHKMKGNDMKYSEETWAMMSLAKSEGLHAEYNEHTQAVIVHMELGEGYTEEIPVYNYAEMNDLVGG